MRYRLAFRALFILMSAHQFARADTCIYAIDSGATTMTWTGYKFTQKTPVSGSFDNIDFNKKSAESVEEALTSIDFSVDTASINSDNPIRDKKLALFVFGKLINPGRITGKVISYSEKEKKAVARLNMNDVTQEVPFQVSVEKNQYTFRGTIDLLDFNMKGSLNAIHTACEALHTGEDGKSKTWSTVDLEVKTKLEEEC